jgi:hypothetical protein
MVLEGLAAGSPEINRKCKKTARKHEWRWKTCGKDLELI